MLIMGHADIENKLPQWPNIPHSIGPRVYPFPRDFAICMGISLKDYLKLILIKTAAKGVCVL